MMPPNTRMEGGTYPRRCALVLSMAVVSGLWVGSAAALDRDGAIEAAKRQVKNRCTTATPCTFTAKQERDKWHVRVDFTKRNSPLEKPGASSGAHAIFIFDATGRVIGRVE
jgi:hypothetical protein